MMLKKLGALMLVICFLLLAAGPAWSAGVGAPAPDFRLSTLEGKPVGLADFKGQPLLLVFWATWCPTCREEVPRINRIAAEYGPKGLAVLAINVGSNDSPDKAAKFRDRHQMAYPVAFDQGSRVTRAFGVFGIPTILLVDRQGGIIYRGVTAPADMAAYFVKANHNR